MSNLPVSSVVTFNFFLRSSLPLGTGTGVLSFSYNESKGF